MYMYRYKFVCIHTCICTYMRVCIQKLGGQKSFFGSVRFGREVLSKSRNCRFPNFRQQLQELSIRYMQICTYACIYICRSCVFQPHRLCNSADPISFAADDDFPQSPKDASNFQRRRAHLRQRASTHRAPAVCSSYGQHIEEKLKIHTKNFIPTEKKFSLTSYSYIPFSEQP